MQNNNHKSDSTCAYGETLVAFLYGEASAAESEKFELHIKQCSDCREELTAFGFLREAIADWRTAQFEPLGLPEIALPNNSQISVQTQTEKSFWLESVRAFLTPFDVGWQMAAASFAFFLILGFLFFGSGDLFNKPNEIAVAPPENTNLKPETNSTPRVEAPSVASPTVQNQAGTVDLNQTATARDEKNSNRTARAISKTPKGSDLRQAKNNNATKRTVRPPKANQTADDLSILPAEPDDETLRLTDLLDEIEPSS